MIFLFILCTALLQWAAYVLLKKYAIKIKGYVIPIVLLLGHFFLFPQFFYPKPSVDELSCGLPILGITFAFWIFGSLATIITHIVWVVLKRHKLVEKG